MEKRTIRSDTFPSARAAQIEDIHRHFPKHTHDEVLEALEDCERELSGEHDSGKLVNCMKSRLAPQAGDGVD